MTEFTADYDPLEESRRYQEWLDEVNNKWADEYKPPPAQRNIPITDEDRASGQQDILNTQEHYRRVLKCLTIL